MKKLLIVCYGGGHVRMISKILPYLEYIDYEIFALTEAQSYLRQWEIPFNSLTDYHDKYMQDDTVEALGREMIAYFGLGFTDRESILYYGYGFKELIARYGKEKAIEGYKRFGRQAFLQIDFMESLIKHIQPKLLFTTNSPRMEKAALIAAKKQGIKTISIENLFGEIDDIQALQAFFGDEYKKIYGDTVCVAYELIKERIKEYTSECIVTGSPVYDDLLADDALQAEPLYRPNTSDPLRICFLSQKLKQEQALIEYLHQMASRRGDQLVIKLHPCEEEQDAKALEEKYENIRIFSEGLEGAITASDIVITVNSSAAVSASILGRIVLAKKNDLMPLCDLDIALEYESLEDIEECIDTMYNHQDEMERLEKGRHELIKYGNAAKAIAYRIKLALCSK